MKIFLAALALMFSALSVSSQQDWTNYKERTLAEIVEQNKEFTQGGTRHYLFTGDVFPSRVSLIYTGEFRAIDNDRKEFIRGFFKSTQHEELADLFKTEALFKENGVEHWLPVQNGLLDALKKEAKKGRKVLVFTNWLGALTREGKVDWVFIVNEFDANESGER